ncbi:MAG: hypothetical protein KJT03_00720 [Verrucomicrobiae bacterium]|nr:hypothetical protein [Verrucomicrobiae bacterium]
MSYLVKKRRSFVLKCYLACQNLVMITLIFSLMLLLAALGLSIYYDEFPVPERLLTLVNERTQEEGLDLQFEKITLDFRGNLLFKNARLAFVENPETALEVEQLYLDINYTALFLNKSPIDLIRLGNATLFGPSSVTRSGTHEKLVTGVNLELVRVWTQWRLLYLTAQFQNLGLTVSGEITALVNEALRPREKQQKKPDLHGDYLRITRLLSDYSKYLQLVEEPEAEITVSSPSRSECVLGVLLHTRRFSQEGLPNAEHIVANVNAQVLPEVKLLGPVDLKVGRVEEPNLKATVDLVSLFVENDSPIKQLEDLFPLRVKAATGLVDVQGNQVEHLVFSGQILDQNSAQGEIITSVYGGPIEADVSGNWKQKKVRGSLRADLNLEGIIARPEFDHLWKLRWSKQNKPIYLDLNFDYPGNLEDVAADFRFETRDIEIIKTPFQWARGRGSLHGTEVWISQLEGGGNGNDLVCTFRQDFKQPFYRFTMVGRFRPHDIDVWWRDWWKNTFDYLDIKGDLPWMDLSIRNAFIYKKQMSLFGYAEAENIGLKGMHFDRASTKMFIRPNYIDATDLHLTRPEGEARGQFQRQLIFSELKNVIVDVTSNLELQPTMELFGESGLRILEPYTWQGNPTITLKGEFNFQDEKPWQELALTIDTDKPMTLYQFPFDSLQVEGSYWRGDILLDEVDFDFAGGHGKGEASFLRQDDNAFLLFDFNVEDADLAETLSRIALVKKSDAKEGPAPEKKKKSEPLAGKLTVKASGIAPAGQGLNRVMAKGDIQIRDGNLAQIPLFGPLSSLIPFTKLRLTDAKSFFAWDDGKMSFPNLVMTSDTNRLEGVGSYYTATSELDFQVKLFLLRETEIPLISDIILPIFDPFSNMAAVNLKGTIQKPEWRFALSPLNLFDHKPGPSPDEAKEPLQNFEFRR